MRIRVARPEDAEAIERVRGSSWRAAYDGLLPAQVIADATGPGAAERRRGYLLLADRHTLIAEIDGTAAGMASYGPERRPPPMRPELHGLYVDPAYWSAGVGRRLMERVVEDVGAAGGDRLSLWVLEDNARARRFYEVAGFAPTGGVRAEGRFGGVRLVRYEKAL